MFTRIFLIIVLIFSVLSLFFIKTNTKKDNIVFVKANINKASLQLELALNDQAWYNGLSNKKDLCSNCGMLFVFPTKDIKTFVMREMNFPLDIIWLADNKIVGYSENLAPESSEPYTPYNSPVPVNQVLEVKAGFVRQNNIKINDNLTYEKAN